METPTPAIEALARRLIALESYREPSAPPTVAAVRTCIRLRATLSKLVGMAGFCALMSRALAMAKCDAPSLAAVKMLPDGSLEGLADADHDADAGVIVVARFLGLLATFIGEPLTLGLVNDIWPDAPGAGDEAGSGGGS